jgi:hypothetical protein
MKKVILALSILLIASTTTTQAQGFLKKLQAAMMVKVNGYYQVVQNDGGTFISPPQGQCITDFKWSTFGDEAGKKFLYNSFTVSQNWYALVNTPGSSAKIYRTEVLERWKCVAVQVEDSIIYFLDLSKAENDKNYVVTAKDIKDIISTEQPFIQELVKWNVKDAPKSDRAKKHLAAIANTAKDIHKSVDDAKAAAEKANDDKIFNSPLPAPGGGNSAKMFDQAKKDALASLKEELENIGIENLEPVYVYMEQQTPYWTVIKDNLGNQIARGANVYVVCKNKTPGEYDFSKKIWKTKYVCYRGFVKQEGSGNTFTGKFYWPTVSHVNVFMVGDDTDPMKYKK